MSIVHDKIKSYDLYTTKENMKEDILSGLQSQRKSISAKYLYDQRGSELFEEITVLDEYYPTRSEIEILSGYRDQLFENVGPVRSLIEYGSGSSKKIKILLDSFQSLKEYIPIDISKEFLFQSCIELSSQYPHLSISAICGDYTSPLQFPFDQFGKRVIFFPGSTIGNFEPEDAKDFLKQSHHLLNEGDGFIIGVDMKKDQRVLEAAYNDNKGITALFNLNLLQRINRELNANFELSQFQHKAIYNEELGRIEMHIISLMEQSVLVDGTVIHFEKGETIHTENSYKYSIPQFQGLARECGFTPVQVWTDKNRLFSVHYIEKTGREEAPRAMM